MVVFNKAIQTQWETEIRLPNVTAKTSHGLAFRHLAERKLAHKLVHYTLKAHDMLNILGTEILIELKITKASPHRFAAQVRMTASPIVYIIGLRSHV